MKGRSKRVVDARQPQQERSQQTVDAILTAAKSLVIRDGCERLTTNGVARRAGVSIGSVYQYFSGKRAILMELRRRHQVRGEETFRAELARFMHAPLPEMVRHFVEQMLEVHRADPELHLALESEGRGARYGEWERRAVGLAQLYLAQHRHELVVEDLEQAAFVVMVTVEALTHGAVLERPDLLKDPTLVDGVVRMLVAYLTGRVDATKAPATSVAPQA